ncbi:MAG: AAA family ATPase [Desulfobacterales bacterium]|nr:AAA family ATPase [Desulfobacterales bacterium]
MDYFELLNLGTEPFSNSPDPDFFFGSQQHKACLQKLEISLRLHRGLNLVIGEVGTGKTTLCRQLIRLLASDEQIETHLILDPQFSNSFEFLMAIVTLFEIDIPGDCTDMLKIKDLIKTDLFRKGVDEEKTILLIIDEGQKLPGFCLEILREFLNYETNKNKLLQIAIFAQREFKQTLVGYANFTDRINLFTELGPLNFWETRAMIQFRLKKSSRTGKLPRPFSQLAFWQIYRTTGGYPRQVITLCHHLILTMIVQKRTRVDGRFVRSCAAQLFTEDHPGADPISKAALVAALVSVVAVAGMIPGRVFIPEQVENAGEQPVLTHKIEPPAVTRNQADRVQTQVTVPDPDMKNHLLPVPPPKAPGIGNGAAADSSLTITGTSPDENTSLSPPAMGSPERDLQGVVLETIRGARHPNFFRIVFQFNEKFHHDELKIAKGWALIHFKGVTTDLRPTRKYKTFDSWVKLDPAGSSLYARIGLPENFKRIKYVLMQNPQRLIVDIFTLESGEKSPQV